MFYWKPFVFVKNPSPNPNEQLLLFPGEMWKTVNRMVIYLPKIS